MSWQKNILFEELTKEELDAVAQYMEEKTFSKEEEVVKEGESGSDIFFIESGEVEILKKDWLDKSYRISLLKEGEVFGEMALVGDNTRFATVKSLSELKVHVLPFSKFIESHPDIASKVSKNLNKLLTSRLSETDKERVSGLRRELIQSKKRASMSSLTVKVFALITLYQVLMQAALRLFPVHHMAIVLSLFMLAIGWILYKFVKDTGYPLKMFGFTTRKWKKSTVESILFTIPLLLLVVGMKYLFIKYMPKYADSTLFDFSIKRAAKDTPIDHILTGVSFYLYILFSPVQEFIFRGVIQSSMQRFLTGKRRILNAILVTNLIFLQAHFYFNFSFIIFLPGLFWSWLYLRHRTLIGASLSHTLVGFWTFYVVGLRP